MAYCRPTEDMDGGKDGARGLALSDCSSVSDQSDSQVRHLTRHFGPQSIVSQLLVPVHCKIFSVQKNAGM